MGALAHKIKPTFGTLNIHLLKKDIRTIENAGKEKKALPDLKELPEKMEQTITEVIQHMKQSYLEENK